MVFKAIGSSSNIMNVFDKIRSVLKSEKQLSAFGIGELIPYVLTFGFAVMIVAVIALVLNGFQTSSSVTVNSVAYNAIGNGLTATANIANQFGLLGTVIGLGLVLGVVLSIFGFGRGGKTETL